jgi:integrase
MARTGMRIGEVTALQWIDIDFAKNYIIVRRNIPHHRQVETTKTVASQREVDMSPELSEELKRLRTERKKQALADGKTFDMESWVFPNEDGSPIHYTNFLRRVWHKVQDQARSGGGLRTIFATRGPRTCSPEERIWHTFRLS